MKKRDLIFGVGLLIFFGGLCPFSSTKMFAQGEEQKTTKKMVITSSAFRNGEAIPVQYTCDGNDLSPPLSWHSIPEGTASFALIVDDPDAPAGTWVHWILFSIPSSVTVLDEGTGKRGSLALKDAIRQGLNQKKEFGYRGPCPPPGHGHHRYFFKLYALDTKLVFDSPSGITKEAVLKEMEGHILGFAQLVGTYERKKKEAKTPEPKK